MYWFILFVILVYTARNFNLHDIKQLISNPLKNIKKSPHKKDKITIEHLAWSDSEVYKIPPKNANSPQDVHSKKRDVDKFVLEVPKILETDSNQ